jgi:hypothetical protein
MTITIAGGALATVGGGIGDAPRTIEGAYRFLRFAAYQWRGVASPTVTRSTMGASFPDYPDAGFPSGAGHPHDQFSSGCAAPSGRVYGIPDESPDILVIDPVAGTASRSAMGADLSGAVKRYKGAAYSPETGLIYCAPNYDTRGVLIIDDAAGTARIDAMGVADYTGPNKWCGLVRAPNGKIYGVPNQSTTFLIIDPVAGTAVRTALPGGTIVVPPNENQWSSGCLGIDGKIYCSPYNATKVLVIDPATDTIALTDFGLDLSTGTWQGSVAGPDGKIYMPPWGTETTDMLVLNPAAGTAARIAVPGAGGTNGKWQSGCVAPDGKVVFVPRSDVKLLVVDTIAGTFTRIDYGTNLVGSSKWHACCQALNGDIYGIPQDSPDILRIRYSVPAFPSWMLLGPVLDKL